jgi:cytochrome c oxidase subunit 2
VIRIGTTFDAIADGASFWLPAAKSTFAGRVDSAFYVIYWICVFFFILIVTMAALFVIKYRRRGNVIAVEESSHHNTILELTWSGIPLIMALAIFVMGFRGFIDLRTPPRDSYQISVTAQKWAWSFTYPNGYEDEVLHVPAGKPVKLVMTSRDVLHCLFIPHFRTKQDVVPGRYTTLWFQADAPDTLPIFCAEFCGTKHSQMLTQVIVHEPAAFDAWMLKAADWIKDMPPAQAGAIVYKKKGCNQCHSIDGSGGIGPTFQGAFGSRRRFTDGSAAAVDENYVRESLLNPKAKVLTGYDPVMPTFQGRLKESEMAALIAYLKSLS